MFAWHPLALPGILSLVAGWAAAAAVFAARPGGAQNRWLALSIVWVATIGAAFTGIRLLMVDAADARAAIGLFVVLNLSSPFVYFRFISTLDAPLSRLVGGPLATGAMAVYTVMVLGLWFAQPTLLLEGVVREGAAWLVVWGPLFVPLLVVVPVVALLLALVGSIAAYRRETSPPLRRKLRAYAIAFATRDGLYAASIVLLVWSAGTSYSPVLNFTLLPLVDIVFIALLAYGFLRTQLFDVDLRLKRTIRQSTIGSAFAVAFFLVSESAEQLLPVEGFWFGVGAAALVTLALQPLRRGAERIAAAVLPGVDDTPAYRAARKREVYDATLAELHRDGSLSERDMAILAELRTRLGLPEVEPSAAG